MIRLFKKKGGVETVKLDFLIWIVKKNSTQKCGPYCPRDECPAYSDERHLGRKCYYSPQCWRGYADIVEEMKNVMPGPTHSIPISLSAGSTPASGLPLTAVEKFNSPKDLHGDHNDRTALPGLAVPSSSEQHTPTNPAGADPPAPANPSSHACDAGSFASLPNCRSCEQTCVGRPKGRA